MVNCEKPAPIGVEETCSRCGKKYTWLPIDRHTSICPRCHDDARSVKSRERSQTWNKSHPHRGGGGGNQGVIDRKNRIRELFDKPCFLCDWKGCGGNRKLIVGVDTPLKDMGTYGKLNATNDQLVELMDENKYIVMCGHHAMQYIQLRNHHEEWTFDDTIEEMVHRMTR